MVVPCQHVVIKILPVELLLNVNGQHGLLVNVTAMDLKLLQEKLQNNLPLVDHARETNRRLNHVNLHVLFLVLYQNGLNGLNVSVTKTQSETEQPLQNPLLEVLHVHPLEKNSHVNVVQLIVNGLLGLNGLAVLNVVQPPQEIEVRL